jgi:hypothetical protein
MVSELNYISSSLKTGKRFCILEKKVDRHSSLIFCFIDHSYGTNQISALSDLGESNIMNEGERVTEPMPPRRLEDVGTCIGRRVDIIVVVNDVGLPKNTQGVEEVKQKR